MQAPEEEPSLLLPQQAVAKTIVPFFLGPGVDANHRALRLHYLALCLSNACWFSRAVDVYVCDKDDEMLAFEIAHDLQLLDQVSVKPLGAVTDPTHLPIEAVRALQRTLPASDAVVYYTEADQVVALRPCDVRFVQSRDDACLSPHRIEEVYVSDEPRLSFSMIASTRASPFPTVRLWNRRWSVPNDLPRAAARPSPFQRLAASNAHYYHETDQVAAYSGAFLCSASAMRRLDVREMHGMPTMSPSFCACAQLLCFKARSIRALPVIHLSGKQNAAAHVGIMDDEFGPDDVTLPFAVS